MESRSPRLWGTVCVLVSATAFGSMAIFAKLAYAAGLTTSSLLFLRFTLAGLCLLPVVLILALLGALVVVTQQSALASFIYTLF